MRYLQATIDGGIQFGIEKSQFSAYVDADFAGDPNERRSTTGYIFMPNGGPVCWSSRRQSCVALSTAEAEYVSLGAATKKAVWLRDLLKELGCEQGEATPLYEDNRSAIALAENESHSRRTRHIHVKYHYVREAIKENIVRIIYCPSEQMVADMMTKSLPSSKFAELRDHFLLVHAAGTSDGSVEHSNHHPMH